MERWFDATKQQIIFLSDPKYMNLSAEAQQKAIWKHAFSTSVDSFVGTNYSIQTTWQNKTSNEQNTLYCIPAEITKSEKTIRGFFQFCFDPSGICYHRYFSEKSGDELVDEMTNNQVWNKIDFPTLEQASLIEKNKKSRKEDSEEAPMKIDSVFEYITFNDEENDLEIKVFKCDET